MRTFLDARINFDLFKYNVKRSRGLLIVFTLVLAVTFPATIFVNAIARRGSSISEQDLQFYLAFMTFVFLVLLVLTPFIFFSYLNSKKSVDVFHSLSITRKDLFITNLTLSLFFVLLPFTLAYWGGYLLAYSTTGIKFDPYHLYHYGRLLMVSLAVIAPSVFVIMNTGTLSDALIYTAILLFAPFIAYGAYEFFAEANIIGFQLKEISNLAYLSPLAGLYASFEFFSENIDGEFIASYWLILGILMNCASVHLYENWKSESSEEPFSNKQFFPLVTSLFIGILFVFFLSISFIPNPGWKFISVENLLIPILTTYALFLILQILKHRSINTVKVASRNYLILILVLLMITSTIHFTQGFGYAYRLPNEKNIQSIEIEANFNSEPFLVNNIYKIQESETIHEVVEIHKSLIDYIKEDKNIFIEGTESAIKSSLSPYGLENQYHYFELTYIMKNNKKMNRRYNIPVELQHEFFKLSTHKEIVHTNYPLTDLDFRLKDPLEVIDPLFRERYEYDYDLRKEDFRKAVESDLLAMSETTYYHSSHPVLMSLVYSSQSDYTNHQINIDARFTETLKILSDHKIKATHPIPDVSYEIIKSGSQGNNWGAHGLSQVLQQGYYGYEGDEVTYYPSIDYEKYKAKLYDKNLSKETNDILTIMSPYGLSYYPIVEE